MDEDRVELLIAAVVGAALGIVIGYLDRTDWFAMAISALIGSVVVSGLVYCLRAFR